MTAHSHQPITLIEVGPRDGLQNEQETVPTDVKIAFVDALSATGLQIIEVTSFVSPRWAPQLADAELVFQGITRAPGIVYTALVPNARGFERAVDAGVGGIALFTAASDTFSRRNTNSSIAESLSRFRALVPRATVPVRAYVSTAFHCPYEGDIAPEATLAVVRDLVDLGCDEISIADTSGGATPDTTERLLERVIDICPVERVAVHFHDTFGRGIPNAQAAARVGITRFDGSVGGVGGCPYAPGAPGNVATEALARAFAGQTGVDLDALLAAADLISPYRGATRV